MEAMPEDNNFVIFYKNNCQNVNIAWDYKRSFVDNSIDFSYVSRILNANCILPETYWIEFF